VGPDHYDPRKVPSSGNGTLLRRVRALMLRMRNLFARRRLETDLAEELESHLWLHVDDNIRAGMTPEEARRQAILALGGIEQTKERYRDRRGFRPIDELARDLQYATRLLRKNLGLTTIAIVSLALGIGANAAIFSLSNQMLLRPLPVPDADRLVNLTAPGPNPGWHESDLAGGGSVAFSYPMFRDLERLQKVFTGIVAHKGFHANLSLKRKTLVGSGLAVSGSYFPVLGVEPARGRLLGPGDDRATGEPAVAVLSHAYWQRSFGGSPKVLNDTLIVNGRRMAIVGITPRGFDGTTLGRHPDVYVPITMYGYMNPGWDAFDDRRNYWVHLFARLRSGVTIDQARTAINTVYRGIVHEVEAPLQAGMSGQTLARFKAKTLRVEPGQRGQSRVHEQVRTPVTLLFVVTGVVLLIACANMANLLLARSATRTTEIAVRLSVGASRRHLIVQLLTESCLLAVLGGLAGLVVATVTVSTVASLFPEGPLAGAVASTLDGDVLLFAAAVTLMTGLLCGLFPAIHSARPNLTSPLKETSGQSSGGRGAARFRTVLATAQIALSMMLLVAAGLFIKSLMNVSRVDLGLKIDNLVTFRITPVLNGYTPQRARVLFERLEDELAAQPGVTSVTASMMRTMAGDSTNRVIRVQGFKSPPGVEADAYANEIAPGYFATMGIPLIAGREFTRADSLNAPKVAIVNEAFAKKFGLGPRAVGARMAIVGDDEGLAREIVGLVQDASYSDVKQDVRPVFFIPYRQDEELGFLNFYVRTAVDPERMLDTLPQVVAKLDPDLAVDQVKTVAQQVRENVAQDRLLSVLSAAFAILATLLAAIGLYGVLAYTVTQRTREIGLRMALGAAPGRVRGMVLRQVVVMTVIGGVIGLAGAVALGRAAQALLFELQGDDPVVLTVAAVALTFVALGAGFLPAHRASRVDPMRALKYE
jgi:predicted permease